MPPDEAAAAAAAEAAAADAIVLLVRAITGTTDDGPSEPSDVELFCSSVGNLCMRCVFESLTEPMVFRFLLLVRFLRMPP